MKLERSLDFIQLKGELVGIINQVKKLYSRQLVNFIYNVNELISSSSSKLRNVSTRGTQRTQGTPPEKKIMLFVVGSYQSIEHCYLNTGLPSQPRLKIMNGTLPIPETIPKTEDPTK